RAYLSPSTSHRAGYEVVPFQKSSMGPVSETKATPGASNSARAAPLSTAERRGVVVVHRMIRWKTFAIGWSLALAILLFAQHKSTMPDPNAYHVVVDLTHDLNDHSPNWEGTDDSPFHA